MLNLRMEKGLTLPELMTAVMIMALAIGGVVSFYMIAQNTWIEGNARIDLQGQARVAMDKIVRGDMGTGGIMEATSVTLQDSSTILYTSGIDAQERSFYLDGGGIMYDPDTSSGGDEVIVAENVVSDPAGLTFSVTGSSVTIDISMEKQSGDRIVDVDLSTQVRLRN